MSQLIFMRDIEKRCTLFVYSYLNSFIRTLLNLYLVTVLNLQTFMISNFLTCYVYVVYYKTLECF